MGERGELWAALLPVADVFEELAVHWYIGGSVASSQTGIARATQDADLVADLRLAQAQPFISTLKKGYYLSPERILDAIRRRGSFNLLHLETMFKVDVFVMPDTPYARLAMARRISLEVPELDRALDFAAPEDTVLAKLEWYEKGRRVSDRQWYDLQGVLRLQGETLDLAHLRRWARELAVEELLERALEDAGLAGG